MGVPFPLSQLPLRAHPSSFFAFILPSYMAIFLAAVVVWGLLPAFSRYSVSILPHVDIFWCICGRKSPWGSPQPRAGWAAVLAAGPVGGGAWSPGSDTTHSTLEAMRGVTNDLPSIQGNTGPSWINKTEKAFFRGRDTERKGSSWCSCPRKIHGY